MANKFHLYYRVHRTECSDRTLSLRCLGNSIASCSAYWTDMREIFKSSCKLDRPRTQMSHSLQGRRSGCFSLAAMLIKCRYRIRQEGSGVGGGVVHTDGPRGHWCSSVWQIVLLFAKQVRCVLPRMVFAPGRLAFSRFSDQRQSV